MGEWAKPGEDFKDGDKLTILDGGTQTTNKYGDQTAFKVQTLKGEKNMAFNQTTTNNLIDAFGDETDGWVGKKVNNTIVKAMIAGELRTVVYLFADGWTMDNKGKFHGPNKAEETASSSGEAVVQLEEQSKQIDDALTGKTPDINPDDIPF